MSNKKEGMSCSFCGREKKDTNVLIAGISGHICDHCIRQAYGIVVEEMDSKDRDELSKSLRLVKPREIKEFLDGYVIGQEDAKRILSVAVYNHYKRLTAAGSKTNEEIDIEKSNIVMVGETGTGKTLLARTIARMLNVPFTIVDATVLTEAGYVGEDVESILSRLLQAADYDQKSAERGIIFIDEIDKIARKGDNPSITRDVSGEGVQQALLKLLEGTTVNVPPQGGRKHPDQKFVEIDTTNILFIAGGAFDGIQRNIAGRLNTQAVGFHGSKRRESQKVQDNLLQYIAPQDLKSFGLIPELIGRLPVLTHLDPLDADILKRILTEPNDALIKQYTQLLQIDDIKLDFQEEALDYVVEKAVEFKLGARGLRSILEAILTDAMFELPGHEEEEYLLTVDADYAAKKIDKMQLSSLRAAS